MSIVVESSTETQPVAPGSGSEAGDRLCSWIMAYLNPWRAHRDTTHRSDWDTFYRHWRCLWSGEDKNRKSERSKLVSPGTMQAVDSTVSEIEEAIFGREQWFQVDEDLDEIEDPAQKAEIVGAQEKLREKFEEHGIPTAVGESVLIGTIYGTGIGKINTEVKPYRYLRRDPGTGVAMPAEKERVCVTLIPLEPYEVIPDPSTSKIDEMLGIAHETPIAIHDIKQGMKDGKYRKVTVTAWNGEEGFGNLTPPAVRNTCLITEWHGLVPSKYLAMWADEKEGKLDDDRKRMYEEMDEDESLTEAIVTIMNRGIVIGAKANEFFMKDRSFVAYPHDRIPNYFWGRGVPEKGFNSQKALDAELRSRIDAMALISHPMMAGDVTRLPRGFNLGVTPGKFWPTTGNPGEILQPFNFGQLNPNTFNQAGDLQNMLQAATGAMDPVTSLGQGGGATDRGMNSASFIKRAKRTMQNIEREFLRPLVQKVMWRYVQFAPDEFPQDYTFRVKGALGVMAREIEQQQNIQLLSVVPNESRPFMVLLKSVFDSSSSPIKAEMVAAVDQMLNPPEDPQAQQEAMEQRALAQRMQVAQVMEIEAKAAKAMADANLSKAKAEQVAADIENDDEDQQLQAIGLATDLKEANAFEHQNRISEQMLQLRAAEISLKGIQAQISMEKVKLEAKKIAKQPAK
jgi:hypothetical protein